LPIAGKGLKRKLSVLGGPGDDLLSRVLRDKVPSALRRLTAEFGMGSGLFHLAESHQAGEERRMKQNWIRRAENRRGRTGTLSVLRPLISVLRLALAIRAIKPDERLVPVSFTRRRASTSGLSTWWSSTALQGELVLRLVSRLDAFSGYPFRI
jgi:hypothetical protein